MIWLLIFISSESNLNIQNIYISMKLLRTLVLLSLCLVITFSDAPTSKLEHQIIDSGTLQIAKQKGQSIILHNVDQQKAIVILIQQDQATHFAPIKVTINTDNQITTCQIDSKTNLCVRNFPDSKSATVKFQSEIDNAKIFWEAHSAKLNSLGEGKIKQLYQITRKQTRMSLNLICKNLSVKRLIDEIKVFSSSEFKIAESQGSVFVLFSELNPGYIFFESTQRAKECTSLKISQSSEQIKEGQVNFGFLVAGKPFSYKISRKQYTHLSFPIEIKNLAIWAEKQKLTIILKGIQSNGAQQVIRSNEVTMPRQFQTYYMTYVVNNLIESYESFQLNFAIEKSVLLFQISKSEAPTREIKALQHSYFDLKKGDKIQYNMAQQPNAQETDEVKINLSDKQKLSSSLQSCFIKTGCHFVVEAKEDIKGSIYVGVGNGQEIEVVVLDFGEKNYFTKKIEREQKIYAFKKLKVGKTYQVVINSQNVIAFMAPKKQCPLPSRACKRSAASLKKHFLYTPKTQQEALVIFTFLGLDKAQFTLTLLEEAGENIPLVESQPFSYIMDDKQSQLAFIFTLPSTDQDVSFNLVAPLHSIQLMVENTGADQSQSKAYFSSEGYVLIKKQEMISPNFMILAQKNVQYMEMYIHLTLIASSRDKFVRLESGIPFYETLAPNKQSTSKFIFQFDTNEDYNINFFSYNAKKEKINIDLDISAEDSWQAGTYQTYIIDKPSDLLKLNQISNKLCEEVEESKSNCQLFMKIENKMEVEIDLAITLMSKHQVLELKDGIWQSFVIDERSTSAHFYFEPLHEDQDITILYKTTELGLRVSYKLFHGNKLQVSPIEWPFPKQEISDDQKEVLKNFRPVSQISISKSQISKCWPYCYVLLSFVDLYRTQFTQKGTFSIMASNSVMELAQHEKIDIIVAEEEEKIFMIDLKYALAQNKGLHISIFHSIGLTEVIANVYSETNMRVPIKQHKDFTLNARQNKISIDQIKQIIQNQKMEDDNNIFLYLTVLGIEGAKISMQYSFQNDHASNIKPLNPNSYQQLSLKQNGSKLYFAEVDNDFQIKIIKQKGTPYIVSKICNKEYLNKCMESILQNKQANSHQIFSKIYTITKSESTQCQGDCIILVNVYTIKEEAHMQIHLQSQFSQIQLIQGKQVYDFTEKEEQNRYALYIVKGEVGFINIQVRQGEIKAKLTDFDNINMQKISSTMMSFQIDTSKMNNPNKDSKQADLTTAFGLSEEFVQIHISIRSTQDQKPSIYTISYSSGVRKFGLQDGMISKYQLQPEAEQTFYYSSTSRNQAFLIVSMERTQYLQNLEIVIKHCEPADGIIDEDCWKDMKIERPQLRPFAPNPTLVFDLPSYENFEFRMRFKGNSPSTVTVGINHEQFMILPSDFEYPFPLRSKKEEVFLFDVRKEGYLQIIIKQCDQSDAKFSYTDDYQLFKKGRYSVENSLKGNQKTEYSIFLKPGTFYMKFSVDSAIVMMTIQLKFSEEKKETSDILPGKNGVINYEILGNNEAQIHFYPVQCPDKPGCGTIKYYAISSQSLQNLNRQLICPNNYFGLQNLIKNPIFSASGQVVQQAEDKSSFLVMRMMSDDQFASIIAQDQQGNTIFYKPIEVSTILGSIKHLKFMYLLALVGVVMLGLLLLSVVITKNARRGYSAIVQMEG